MPKDNLFYRSFSLDRAAIDEEKRMVRFVFSTETPVERYLGHKLGFGPEILLHGEENVDLSRLRISGSGLFNHNPDKIIGPLMDVSIVDWRGVGVLGFDDDEIGNMAYGKIMSGSLRGVSVGYDIELAEALKVGKKYQLRSGQEITGPALIATRWTPGEISLTPIPADINSGIGRTRSLEGIQITEIGIEVVDENHDDYIRYKLQKQRYGGNYGKRT